MANVVVVGREIAAAESVVGVRMFAMSQQACVTRPGKNEIGRVPQGEGG